MQEKKPIRKRTTFLCAMDGCQLELVPGKYRAYYCCPKRRPQNREQGEPACYNRLSLKEADMLYEILERMEKEGELIRGAEMEAGQIYINISHAQEDGVRVYALNRKSERL